MTLTNEQMEAIAQGRAVPVVVDGRRCVLIRQDVYERGRRLIDNAMDPEEAYPAILEAWDSVGSPQDAIDYQR